MKQNEHGRILADAAKRHLPPAGARRKGQSRIWLIDHGYWVIQIEFQPSGWSKGSHLNVGAHWLWKCEPGPISFDHNYRVEDFISFQSREQFEPEADRLASRAADEARKLGTIFSSVADISQVLTSLVEKGRLGWPIFHAAVAAGLAGNILQSRQLFERVEAEFSDPAQSVAAKLKRLLDQPTQYRSAIEAMVAQQRTHNNLPICPNPFATTGQIETC